MNFKTILVALAATLMGFSTYAETSTTTGETKTKVEGQNKVEGDIDNEITNARMRAESGSKSKLSASVGVSYSGGSLEDPFDYQRADLLGGDNRPAVGMGIDVSGRLRLDKNSSLSAGTGLTIVQPFHSTDKNPEHDSYSDKTQLSSPYLTYSNYRSKGNWAFSNSASVSITTTNRDRDVGQLGSLSNTNRFLYDFKNGIQAGSYISFGTTFYEAKNNPRTAIDFSFNVDPFAEYVLSDTYNLRTVLNLAAYLMKHKANYDLFGNKSSQWSNGSVRQSFGLGIAVNRDVFLYPNIQISARDFYADASFENSTVGMSATINAF